MCFPQRRSALQKMVEFTPLPLLFMRTVIQAETAAPTLREFTLGLLRTLARRQVWRMDPKIWEGFARCAKRSAPRSFPLLCELPPSALGEMLGKFPAMRQPLLAYASAPAVQSGISRAIMAVLQEDKQQQG
jgi:symplekin